MTKLEFMIIEVYQEKEMASPVLLVRLTFRIVELTISQVRPSVNGTLIWIKTWPWGETESR